MYEKLKNNTKLVGGLNEIFSNLQYFDWDNLQLQIKVSLILSKLIPHDLMQCQT